MKKIFLIFAAALLLTSCAITLPVNATSNEVGSKVGMSKATGYLNVLWFDQDASIQKAAKQGVLLKFQLLI
jgi:phosphate/sulfate permease